MRYAIQVDGLTKRYGNVRALDGISFAAGAGELFAFVGSNGAGKSTTIGALTATLAFDSGTAEVAGLDVRGNGEQVRAAIGVVFQNSLLDDRLTVRENLDTRARFYALTSKQTQSRIAELADLVGLHGFIDRRYGTVSGGQRRRADIARALLHTPSVLFLDEPTAGLDPAARAQLWEAIATLRDERGLTVFLTTHYMEETEQADQLCVLDSGRLIATGTPTKLRAAYSASQLTMTTRNPAELEALGARLGMRLSWVDDVAAIEVRDAQAALELLDSHRSSILDFELRHGSMDDVFLALTGHELTTQAS